MIDGILVLLLGVACLFFGIIPLGGAFVVRSRWRLFRQHLSNAVRLPVFQNSAVTLEDKSEGMLLFGQVEAIQGNEILWIRAGDASVQVFMNGHNVHVLSDEPLDITGIPPTPVVHPWQQLGPIAEGSGVFIAGTIEFEAGRFIVRDWAGQPPFLVLSDSDPATLFARLTWSGRQRNEYWNIFTPVSLLIGFVALSLLGFIFLRETSNRLWAVIGTSLSLLPFVVLLPPGIVGFFVYRRLWRKGRRFRAYADLTALGQQLSHQATAAHEQDIVLGNNKAYATFGGQSYQFQSPGFSLRLRVPGSLSHWRDYCRRHILGYETCAIGVFLGSLGLNWLGIFVLVAQIVG